MNDTQEVGTQEIGFADRFKSAVALIDKVMAITVIKDAQEFEAARLDHQTLIEFEKQLETDYKTHPVVIAAKAIQEFKGEVARKLKTAKDRVKNEKMWNYEQEQERIRLAKEEELRKIEAKRVQDEKDAAIKLAKEKSDKESAEALAASEAAAAAGQSSTAEAHLEAAVEAEQQGREVVAEIVAAPVVVAAVVIPRSTPKAAGRRMEKKWRITLKNGSSFTSDDFKKVVRIPAADVKNLPIEWAMVNHTAITAKVDSLGKAAEVPGLLEVWEVPA